MVTFFSTGERLSTWIFMLTGGPGWRKELGGTRRNPPGQGYLGGEGLEPSSLSAPEPKSGASASSATRPRHFVPRRVPGCAPGQFPPGRSVVTDVRWTLRTDTPRKRHARRPAQVGPKGRCTSFT